MKNKKKQLDLSSFYTCVPQITIRSCTVPEIWCMTDGQTNGRMEKVTYRGVGAPPKNSTFTCYFKNLKIAFLKAVCVILPTQLRPDLKFKINLFSFHYTRNNFLRSPEQVLWFQNIKFTDNIKTFGYISLIIHFNQIL